MRTPSSRVSVVSLTGLNLGEISTYVDTRNTREIVAVPETLLSEMLGES